MKKILLLASCIFLLSGCSLFADYYNADQLANEMDQLVRTENDTNDKINQDLEKKYEEASVLIQSVQVGDKAKLEEINKKIEEAKAISTKYKQEVQKIQKQFPDLKAKAAKLEDPEIKKLADTFIGDFTKTTETEIKQAEEFDKLLVATAKLAQDIVDNKEPNLDEYDAILDNIDQLAGQLNPEIENFNKSWNAFHKAAIGTEIQQPK
ncbi:hypothetical protein [Hazenella coriacea]|uniref:Putative cell-wall binding lipoprotein n=1 Tax=Hazenella coriacea TaxID=1179467 RepID=A0A4R3L9I3_9BACL|nr:hypothetical protein [Hazenella coriacea]TCS95765.1 putative cell-wall binding lipoprotein [Hazenella coriacea]